MFRGPFSVGPARARDGYDPPDSHARADMDLVTALVQLHLGALDLAESIAAVSGRTDISPVCLTYHGSSSAAVDRTSRSLAPAATNLRYRLSSRGA